MFSTTTKKRFLFEYWFPQNLDFHIGKTHFRTLKILSSIFMLKNCSELQGQKKFLKFTSQFSSPFFHNSIFLLESSEIQIISSAILQKKKANYFFILKDLLIDVLSVSNQKVL